MIPTFLLALAVGASAPRQSAMTVSVPDILGVTDLSGLSVSPDGRLVAFRTQRASVEDNSYRLAWYVMPVDRSLPPRLVADGGGALFTDAGVVADQVPHWSPDSDAIFVRALVDGQVQVWRAPVNGQGARPVTHDPANVRDFTIADDGSLAYEVGATRTEIDDAERQAHDDGVLVDASVDIAQPISRGAFLDGRPASQRLTGDWFAHGDILWRTPLRTVHLPAVVSTTGGASKPASFLGAGTILLGREAGLSRLEIRIPGKPPIVCAASPCRVGHVVSAIWLNDGKSLLITSEDAALGQTLAVWRPGDREVRILASMTGLLNGDALTDRSPCAPAPSVLVCVEADPVGPPRLVTVDLGTGARHDAYDPNASLRAQIATRSRTLAWTDAKGTAFTAQLLFPSGSRPPAGFPLVMTYYACPGFLRGGLGDELPLLPLASRGVATLCINQPRRPTNGRTDARSDYDRALSGVTAIVDQLAHEGLIDRARVGMWGLSFGSEITMTVARRSTLLAAASIATGQLEPGFYWFNAVAGRDAPDRLRRTWKLGTPDEDSTDWKAISPALDAGDLRAPLLMQLPEQEARWTMELYSRLSRSTTPVEMYAFANEPHVKEQPRHKLAAYDRNLDWFRFWLQGYQDPDPAKVEQYARWRALAARRTSARALADRSSP